MKKSMELREKRGVVAAEAAACAESNPEQFEKLMKEVETLAGTIERLERAEKLDAELRSTVRPPLEQIGNAINGPVSEERAAAHKKAFRNYLVSGDVTELRVNASEKRSHSGRCWSGPVIHQSPLARMQYEL